MANRVRVYDLTNQVERQEYVFNELEPLRRKRRNCMFFFLLCLTAGMMPFFYVYVTKQPISYLWLLWTLAFFCSSAWLLSKYIQHTSNGSDLLFALRPKN